MTDRMQHLINDSSRMSTGWWRQRRLRTMLAIATLLMPFAIQGASIVTRINTDSSSGVTIEVKTPYEKLPSCGVMPARIRISNQSGAKRTWTLTATSQVNYRHKQTHLWTETFTVAHQGERVFEVFLPMSTLVPGPYQRPSLRLKASGYGCRGYASTISHARAYRGGGSRASADALYRAVSDKLVADVPYFASNAIPNSLSLDFRFALEDASANPIAYHAIDQFWVTEDEWRRLSNAEAQAIAQWVRLGGLLVMSRDTRKTADFYGFPTGIFDGTATIHYGFGVIKPIWDAATAVTDNQIRTLQSVTDGRHSQISTAHDHQKWMLRHEIGDLSYPVVIILVFTISFALLLGPINLIVALRRRRAAQMLWTTPVFSLAAGIILALVILLKDGVGGHGLRMELNFLDPHSHTLSTIQEQIAMTGVLLNDGFKLDPGTTVTALRTDSRLDKRNRLYREKQGYHSGSWFSSRSLQAQLLERAKPTRERIERVKSDAPDAPPTLQSAVGKPLHEVFYRDPAGTLWYTPTLQTGERKTLNRVPAEKFDAWWQPHRQRAGMRMGMALDRVKPINNMFYADVKDDDGLMLETLSSIRWKNRGIILTGLVETGGVL